MKNTIYFIISAFLLFSLIGCGKEEIKQHIDKVKNNPDQLAKRVMTKERQYSDIEVFPDIKEIITRKVLNVGLFENADPPFVIKDATGEIIGGLDIEIAESLAKRLGVKIEFYSINTQSELFKKLYDGELDIALGEINHTFEGSKYVYYSNTYVRLRQSLIVDKKEAIALNIRDNPYKYICENACKIGVHDDSYIEYAENLFPKAEIYEYSNLQEDLNALKNHEILAILADDNEIMLLARKNPEIVLDATVYELKYQNDNIAIVISPKRPNLCDYINLYLESHDYFFDVNSLIDKYPEAYKGD